jgi:hypothetical protein
MIADDRVKGVPGKRHPQDVTSNHDAARKQISANVSNGRRASESGRELGFRRNMQQEHVLLEQRGSLTKKEICQSLPGIRQATWAYVVFMIVTPDYALLYNHRIVKSGRDKAPEMPATERALEAAS